MMSMHAAAALSQALGELKVLDTSTVSNEFENGLEHGQRYSGALGKLIVMDNFKEFHRV